MLARKRSTQNDRVAITNLTRVVSQPQLPLDPVHRTTGATASVIPDALAASHSLHCHCRRCSEPVSLPLAVFSLPKCVFFFCLIFAVRSTHVFHWPLSTLTVELGCYPIGLPKRQCACLRARSGSMHGCEYLCLFNKLAT